MDKWPFAVDAGIAPEDAQKHCVQDANWQKCRLSMKGKPTAEKLDILWSWWQHGKPSTCQSVIFEKIRQVKIKQVVNYLGALRRGGQLNANNEVAKYI